MPRNNHYVNKFSDGTGGEYYIRFTVRQRKAKPGKTGDSHIHSTAISDVSIYNTKTATSKVLRVIDPVLSGSPPFVDNKLQDFFDSVNPDITLNSPGSRGYVEFGPDQYRIVLGKNANLSTLIHETGHVFEEELRRIVDSGQADERQIAANCITMADTFSNGHAGKWSAFLMSGRWKVCRSQEPGLRMDLARFFSGGSVLLYPGGWTDRFRRGNRLAPFKIEISVFVLRAGKSAGKQKAVIELSSITA
ncbi:MAG: hypothetical protein LBB52_05830 [Desulfovibrio sp.]|jgi:hypothetical protein|nr:hypothetical protein [Desulfovibrio sp.]